MTRPPHLRPTIEAGKRTTAPSLNQTVPDSNETEPPTEPREACLVVIRGGTVGRKYDLDAEITVGRDAGTTIRLDDGLVSRTHAKFTPDGAGVRVFDMCSTNGTYVNEKAINTAYLDDGDQIAIGNTVFKFISSNNIEAAYHEHVYSLTRVDALTGVHNRPTFDNTIASAIAASAKTGRPLALMLFDIDHFKRCNDTFGHLAGDHVLREIGKLLDEQLRPGDFAARYGGEEFAVVLHNLPPPAPARFADHFRERVRAHRFEFEGAVIPVTISLGVAQWSATMESSADLIELTDRRLYAAKQGGRNQVVAE